MLGRSPCCKSFQMLVISKAMTAPWQSANVSIVNLGTARGQQMNRQRQAMERTDGERRSLACLNNVIRIGATGMRFSKGSNHVLSVLEVLDGTTACERMSCKSVQ